MEKIWLKSYPEGVPAEIDLRAHASLKDILETELRALRQPAGVQQHGRDADLRRSSTRMSRSFGAYLQASAGLSKGDRVAIMMPNLLQYPVTLFGALRAGMTVVNVNPLYTAARAAAPAGRLGRQGDRGAGELRPHARNRCWTARRSSGS